MQTEELIIKRIDNLCKRKDNEKKLTPYRVAINAEMNPRSLNNILSGTIKDPRISTIKKICKGLNISLKEFFNDDLFH